ncbi:hypothetical protein [Amycolatopsis lexingtonensis]|uniref:hypothetical protein n=1 Tax=Amycolatopsis lexingtonensis TaxID=218822 RepID=UPI003F6F7394
MTNPIEEPGFLFRMILDKLDGMDRKLDGQAEKLVSHDIRLGAAEKDLAGRVSHEARIVALEKEITEQKATKSETWKVWIAVAIAVLSGVLGWLLPLITK